MSQQVYKRYLFTYRSLLAKYLAPQWLRVLIMTVLLLIYIALQLINALLLRTFIDNSTASRDIQSLLNIGFTFIGLALVAQLVSVCTRYFTENVAWEATNSLRADLITHCLSFDPHFYKVHTPGELIERIDGDIDILSNFFSQAIVYLFGNALLIIGIVILLFQSDWRLGIVLGLFSAFALFILEYVRRVSSHRWIAERQNMAQYYGFLGEQLTGMEDVCANGAVPYVLRKFIQITRERYPIKRNSNTANYSLWISVIIIFALGNTLVLGLGAYLWSIKVITIGTVYMAFYSVNLLTDPIEQIRNQLQDLQMASACITRILQLFSMEPAICGGSEKLPPGALSIEWQNVSFEYNPNEYILHDISFSLLPGRILGLLGRTGSGKTTIARLLLRFYDAQEGKIVLGDKNIKDLELKHLRQRVGMVSQDVQLFHATVRDNLTFFDTTIPDTTILSILEDLKLTTWYSSLPDGLDTMIGANGEGLSAGEAQLFAFARIFLANPGLVILDEASSRLDPATEHLIEHAVNRLLVGRTAIIIAHRLSTIQRADEILIIEDGRIIETGERAMLVEDMNSQFVQLLKLEAEEVQS